ncbi:MAG: hypothetical protein IPH33_13490 [Bacteroidetes bacterium]|nr:hypothetical protein [Bacteroidota bacterium]
MSYVALPFGSRVMGNATLENVLSDMVVVFHNAGIKVALVGASTFLMTTPLGLIHVNIRGYFSTDETNVLQKYHQC